MRRIVIIGAGLIAAAGLAFGSAGAASAGTHYYAGTNASAPLTPLTHLHT